MEKAAKGKFMKNPEEMSTDELIDLADEIKRGMTAKLLKDLEALRKADNMVSDKMASGEAITKKEAIEIADRVKSGMSVRVLNDLKQLASARPKVLRE